MASHGRTLERFSSYRRQADVSSRSVSTRSSASSKDEFGSYSTNQSDNENDTTKSSEYQTNSFQQPDLLENSSSRSISSRSIGSGQIPDAGNDSSCRSSGDDSSYQQQPRYYGENPPGSGSHGGSSAGGWNIPPRNASSPEYEEDEDEEQPSVAQDQGYASRIKSFHKAPSDVSGLSDDLGSQGGVNFPDGGRRASRSTPDVAPNKASKATPQRNQPDPFATLNSTNTDDDNSEGDEKHPGAASSDGSFYEYFPTNRDSYRRKEETVKRRETNAEDIVSRPWRKHMANANQDNDEDGDVRSRGNEKSEVMSFAGTDFSPTPDYNAPNRRVTMDTFRDDSYNSVEERQHFIAGDNVRGYGGIEHEGIQLTQSDPSVAVSGVLLPLESQQALEALMGDQKLREEHLQNRSEDEDDDKQGNLSDQDEDDIGPMPKGKLDDDDSTTGSSSQDDHSVGSGKQQQDSLEVSKRLSMSESSGSGDEELKNSARKAAALAGFGAVIAIDDLNTGKDKPMARYNLDTESDGDQEINTAIGSMAGTMASMGTYGTGDEELGASASMRRNLTPDVSRTGFSQMDLSGFESDDDRGIALVKDSSSIMLMEDPSSVPTSTGRVRDSDMLFDFHVQHNKKHSDGFCGDPFIQAYKWWLIFGAVLGFGLLAGLSTGFALLVQAENRSASGGSDTTTTWSQVGKALLGGSAGDLFGTSISQSNNGKVLAVGASRSLASDGRGLNAGQVRVYSYDQEWSSVGSPIFGNSGDMAGQSVSLSGDGITLAVGFRSYSGFQGINSGKVAIFRHSDGEWLQKGESIEGEKEGDEAGYSVSISEDGKRVAIPAWLSNDCGDQCGSVRIFEFLSSEAGDERWQQIGETIVGNEAFDLFGVSVSLSRDGRRVAVGAPQIDGGRPGYVKVYEYQDKSHMWNKLGPDIEGAEPNSWTGRSVAMSEFGERVVVGASNYGSKSGRVVVYQFDVGDQLWKQVGQVLTGPPQSMFGVSVSISGKGDTIIVGGDYFTGQGPEEKGAAQVFVFDGSSWNFSGSSMMGSQYQERFGNAVSMSKEGLVAAVGGYGFDAGDKQQDTNAGQVRVFTSDET